MLGDPGHGKDMVDGINACDKRYLMGEMCMIGTPEVDDKQSRMNTYSMVGSASFNLAKECKRLCDDETRVNGVKGTSNTRREKTHKNLKKTRSLTR